MGEDDIVFIQKSYTPAAAKADLKAAGLKVHGIVARGSDGKLIDAVEGHSYGKPRVQKVVKSLLEKE